MYFRGGDFRRTPQAACGGQLPFTGEPFQALLRLYNPEYMAATPHLSPRSMKVYGKLHIKDRHMFVTGFYIQFL